YPEGVMFSILIMNAVVPYLDRIITRKYGWVRPVRAGRDAKKETGAK
ncbi:NADH-quinone reductase, partial [Citrobacter sp. AAK_AS5]